MKEERYGGWIKDAMRTTFVGKYASLATLLGVKDLVEEIDEQTMWLRRACSIELFLNLAFVMKKHLEALKSAFYAEFNFRSGGFTNSPLYDKLNEICQALMSGCPPTEKLHEIPGVNVGELASVNRWLMNRRDEMNRRRGGICLRMLDDELAMCSKLGRLNGVNPAIDRIYADRIELYEQQLTRDENATVPDAPSEFFTAFDRAILDEYGDVFYLNAAQQHRATQAAETLRSLEKEAQTRLIPNPGLFKAKIDVLIEIYYCQIAISFAQRMKEEQDAACGDALRNATCRLLDLAELRATRTMSRIGLAYDDLKAKLEDLSALRDDVLALRKTFIGLE